MTITNSEIRELTKHGNSFRARYRFTLSDGRIFDRGPISVSSLEEANTKISDTEQNVLKSIKRSDAEEAIDLGIQDIHKEASKNDVLGSWLKQALNEDEYYKVYKKMKIIVPYLISLNKTNTQLANLLSMTLEEIKDVKALWNKLKSFSIIFDDYITIKEGI